MAPPEEILYLANNDTYNLWAPTYDTDGNILQAIDNHQLVYDLFPSAISTLLQNRPEAITVTDLGAGTGRASLSFLSALMQHLRSSGLVQPLRIRLCLLDSSTEMLNLARTKLVAAISSIPADLNLTIDPLFREFDMASPFPHDIPSANLVFSTLVLEHLPIATFFSAIGSALSPNGQAVVTNMHSAMGLTTVSAQWKQGGNGAATATGAGFKDDAGRKVRAAEDWAHDETEVEAVAKQQGLHVVGTRKETSVTPEMLESGEGGGAIRLGDRGKKWVGVKVWAGWSFTKP